MDNTLKLNMKNYAICEHDCLTLFAVSNATIFTMPYSTV